MYDYIDISVFICLRCFWQHSFHKHSSLKKFYVESIDNSVFIKKCIHSCLIFIFWRVKMKRNKDVIYYFILNIKIEHVVTTSGNNIPYIEFRYNMTMFLLIYYCIFFSSSGLILRYYKCTVNRLSNLVKILLVKTQNFMQYNNLYICSKIWN